MKWTKEQFAEVRDFLKRDSGFEKHYMRGRGGSFGYRRAHIGDYLSPWTGSGRTRLMPIGLPSFATKNDVEDRDQLRRYFDADWCFPQEEVNKYAHIPDWDDVETVADVKNAILYEDECPKPTPLKFNIIPKAPTMNVTATAAIKITTKTLINGQDITDFTDSQIFDLIAQQEKTIEKLREIKAQPKKLVKELAERQAGIAALVAYLDSQE